MDVCGAALRGGRFCRNPAGVCPYHRHLGPDEVPELPERMSDEALHDLVWWTLRALMKGTIDVRRAMVASNLVRLAKFLGPTRASREEQLREVELRVVDARGAAAERGGVGVGGESVTPEAVEMFHSWERKGTRDEV